MWFSRRALAWAHYAHFSVTSAWQFSRIFLIMLLRKERIVFFLKASASQRSSAPPWFNSICQVYELRARGPRQVYFPRHYRQVSFGVSLTWTDRLLPQFVSKAALSDVFGCSSPESTLCISHPYIFWTDISVGVAVRHFKSTLHRWE